MAEFSYEALDKGGKQVKGTIEASSEEVIIEKLRDMGYYPLRVTLHEKKGASPWLAAWSFRQAIAWSAMASVV